MDDSEGNTGWKAVRHNYQIKKGANKRSNARAIRDKKLEIENLKDTEEFLCELKETLTKHDAKTWNAIHPEVSEARPIALNSITAAHREEGWRYAYLSNPKNRSHDCQYVPEHLVNQYDELYEACYAGDNDTIQRLCLPVWGQGATTGEGLPSPLNISVRQIDPSMKWSTYGKSFFAYFHGVK